MTSDTAPSTDEFRALLDEQRQHYLDEIARLTGELTDGQAVDGSTDPVDGGSRIEQERQAARLVGAEQQALAEVEAAMARLAAGTYGACEACGAAIPAERLQVLPQTRCCVTCQQQRSARR